MAEVAIALQFYFKKNDNEKCFDKLSKIEAGKCVERVFFFLLLYGFIIQFICVNVWVVDS